MMKIQKSTQCLQFLKTWYTDLTRALVVYLLKFQELLPDFSITEWLKFEELFASI